MLTALESVPSSFIINICYHKYNCDVKIALVKVINEGEGIPSKKVWITDLLLTVSFPIINSRKRTETLFYTWHGNSKVSIT